MFFKEKATFHYLMAAFSFLALQSTNRLSNRYSQMLGWGLFKGGLLTICSFRIGAYLKGAYSMGARANLRIYAVFPLSRNCP